MSEPAVKTALDPSPSLDTVAAPRATPSHSEQLLEGKFSFQRPSTSTVLTPEQKPDIEIYASKRAIALPNSTTYSLENTIAVAQNLQANRSNAQQNTPRSQPESQPLNLATKISAPVGVTVLDRLMNWLVARIEQLVRFLVPSRQTLKVRKKVLQGKKIMVGSTVMADPETIAAIRGASQTNLSKRELDLIIASGNGKKRPDLIGEE